MTPLSSQTTADANQNQAMQIPIVTVGTRTGTGTNAALTSQSSPATNPQQAPLKRAEYVKVVDLATLNKLDIEKIMLETTAKKKEELASTDTLKADDENESGGCGESRTTVTTSPSQEDDSSLHNKYQKRVVPCTGGFNLCL